MENNQRKENTSGDAESHQNIKKRTEKRKEKSIWAHMMMRDKQLADRDKANRRLCWSCIGWGLYRRVKWCCGKKGSKRRRFRRRILISVSMRWILNVQITILVRRGSRLWFFTLQGSSFVPQKTNESLLRGILSNSENQDIHRSTQKYTYRGKNPKKGERHTKKSISAGNNKYFENTFSTIFSLSFFHSNALKRGYAAKKIIQSM